MSIQSNKSSLKQFLPERILTSSKATHLTSTFSVVISRKSQGWMRTDRWAIEAQTGITYIAVALLLFQPQAFSLSLYEKFCFHSLTKFVQSCMNFEQLFLSRLDWRPVTEKSQLNAWARAGKEIKLSMFLFLCFLVWPYNKHLINRARSVCMGESSRIQTSRSVNKS